MDESISIPEGLLNYNVTAYAYQYWDGFTWIPMQAARAEPRLPQRVISGRGRVVSVTERPPLIITDE